MGEIEKLPVYRKANELYELCTHIADYLKENDKKEHLKSQIVINAMTICAKIAGAEGSGLYSLKIENAIKIKFAVREMFEAVLFAGIIKINNNDYVQLVRDAIEDFRIEFIKWIRSFDIADDCKDDWGIRYVVDLQDDFEVKMVNTEPSNVDPDDLGFPDWIDDSED